MKLEYLIYAAFTLLIHAGISVWYVRQINRDSGWWWLMPVYFGMTWNLVSLVVIEYGFYITEQGTFSSQTGAAFRYLLFILPVGLVLNAIGSSSNKESVSADGTTGRSGTVETLALAACAVVVAMLTLNSMLSPSGWSGGVDRFNWWENSRFPRLQMITGTVCWPVVYGLGILLANFTRRKETTLRLAVMVVAAFYLFFLVRMGQKFNGLTVPVFALFLPIACVQGFQLRATFRSLFESQFRQRLILGTLFFTLVVTGLGFLVYRWFDLNAQSASVGMDVLDSLLYRAFVIQAHSYFGADYLHFRDHFTPEEGRRVFDQLQFSSIQTVMGLVGDLTLVESYNERGVRFATIHPSFAVLVGGIPGALILSTVIGGIMAVAVRWFRSGLRQGSPLLQFCAANLVFCAYGLFMMGEVTLLLSVKFLAPLLIGCALVVMESKR